jgi:ribosomal protein S12 methylthiotransferase
VRFSVVTLGCEKNTVDSERYVAELAAVGGVLAARPDDAELVVVNTCGFVDAAKKESIDAILEATRQPRGPRRMVAAVGCMVERHRDELAGAIPEVDLFLGTRDVDRLVEEVRARGLLPADSVADHPGARLYTGGRPHVRYLKISEGCDHGCAFCAIPLMRGRHRSFDAGDLVREAQLLEAQGAREINLVAQDLAHYGRDRRDGKALPELLRHLLDETTVPWYRLLYIYSAGLTDRLLDLMAAESRIVRYFDIPMQHGADTVLARMRRPERRATLRSTVNRIRAAVPGAAVRTTVIVGFPGETDAEFQELLAVLEELALERVAVFTYSPQEATRAHAMEDSVPDEIKRERAERVQELQRLITEERYEAMVGRTVRAMVDVAAASGGPAECRIDAQADDIDGITWVATDGVAGTILDVRLDEVVDSYDFRASACGRGEPPASPRAGAARRALPLMPTSIASYGRSGGA